MENKSYKNLIGVFAVLIVGFVLFGCTSQPPAPVPNPTICAADLYLCQDGTQVARNPANNCQFTACPRPTVCTQDTTLCPDGSYVGRNADKNCAFDDCPPLVGNDSDSHGCRPSAGYSWCAELNQCIRPWETNCTALQQNDTSPAPINSSLAAEGDECAGMAGIACQPGLQCITSGQPGAIGTCSKPAPPTQEMQQCPEERPTSCTAEINPVCGKGTDTKATFRDYINACEACSIRSNAIGYYTGTCENK